MNGLHKKIIVILLVIILICVAFYSIYLSNSLTNSDLFRKYEASIYLEIEEGISVEGATTITLLSLEALNQTFNYSLNLMSTTILPDDNVSYYSNEYLNQTFWLEGYNTSSLLETKKNGTVNIILRFVTGKGQEIFYPNNISIKPVGLSNYGNRIIFFYGNIDQLGFTINAFNLCKSIQHEFGHAFGLSHNKDSSMMYSPEVDNDTIPPNPPATQRVIETGDTLIIGLNDTSFQEFSKCYDFLMNSDNDIWLINSTINDQHNFSIPQNYSPDYPLVESTYNVSHYAVYKTPSFDNVSMFYIKNKYRICQGNVIVVETNVEGSYFDLTKFRECWTDDEIAQCVD